MEDETKHAITQRGHKIWEEEGRPDGSHEDHWKRAEVEHDSAGEVSETGLEDIAGQRVFDGSRCKVIV